ncbi:hypothetical protein [Alkalicoccus luteus]|uniref:hypothetical protein n=1 Tax=Alkalicoccus luteus TaxID=1237094 RepID=UPI004034B439
MKGKEAWEDGAASTGTLDTSGRFYPYESQSRRHNQARETHCQLPASKDFGSERGEDPALPTEDGKAETVATGKRVSADTGRCNVIHLK